MNYNNEQATEILGLVEERLHSSDDPALRLRTLWAILLTIRARTLANNVRTMVGDQVISGPFKGMKLTRDAIAGYNACLMLGTYEHELHPFIEKIIAGHYTHILNIGCSVGYYAVGLALRMPHMIIDAFEIDPAARSKCAEMAKLNGVEHRVRIAEEFHGKDFAAYTAGKTLAIVDIEAAETTLLNPEAYPALQKIDVIVELHDVANPEISGILAERFAPTHEVEIIRNRNAFPDLGALLPHEHYLDPFDHLLLGWEGRGGPTPWGVFTVKAPAKAI